MLRIRRSSVYTIDVEFYYTTSKRFIIRYMQNGRALFYYTRVPWRFHSFTVSKNTTFIVSWTAAAYLLVAFRAFVFFLNLCFILTIPSMPSAANRLYYNVYVVTDMLTFVYIRYCDIEPGSLNETNLHTFGCVYITAVIGGRQKSAVDFHVITPFFESIFPHFPRKTSYRELLRYFAC